MEGAGKMYTGRRKRNEREGSRVEGGRREKREDKGMTVK